MKSLYLLLALFFALTSSYQLSQADPSQKAKICNDQIATCSNICQLQTTKNSCDQNSMTFECVCQNGKVPTDKEVTFPVTFFQCTGSQQECAGKCPSGSDSCLNACNQQFKCNNLDPSVLKNVTQPSNQSGKKGDLGNSDDSAGSTVFLSLSMKAFSLGLIIMFLLF